jgi:microcystin-dependent protein
MGWLKCDGRQLDTTTYAILFNVIGYTFGGSGNTFYLPDMQGRVPGAAGTGRGNDPIDPDLTTRAIGDYIGEEEHRLTINEMPSHTHGSNNVSGDTNGSGTTSTVGNHSHDIITANAGAVYGNRVGQATDTVLEGPASTEPAGSHSHTIGNTGGSNYHNNMQPTLFVGNMFIYCGRNMDNYFPYQWVASSPGTVAIY